MNTPSRCLAAVAVLLVIVGGIAACSGAGAASEDPSPLGLQTPDPAMADPNGFGVGQTIRITDHAVLPGWLISVVDEDVTWVNETDHPVRMTFSNGTVNSGPIAPGETFVYRPDVTISIVYFVHGEAGKIRGAIQVEPEYMPGETPYASSTPAP